MAQAQADLEGGIGVVLAPAGLVGYPLRIVLGPSFIRPAG
jgi:hypothetical protein